MHGALEVDARTAPDLYAIVRDLLAARRPADAEGLSDGQSAAERIRDRPQPRRTPPWRSTTGLLRRSYPRGGRRRDRARTGAYRSNRDTLDHDDHRDPCRRHLDARHISACSCGGNRDNNNGMGLIGALAMVILAPLAAMLVQMAISRTREYSADHLGAQISGEPLALASALAKIAQRGACDPERDRRAQPGDRAYVHHQPAVGRSAWTICSRPTPATENRIAAPPADGRRGRRSPMRGLRLC